MNLTSLNTRVWIWTRDILGRINWWLGHHIFDTHCSCGGFWAYVDETKHKVFEECDTCGSFRSRPFYE